MGKLHELLAVEKDKKEKYDTNLKQLMGLFQQRVTLYNGSFKSLEMFDDDGVKPPSTQEDITRHVSQDIGTMNNIFAEFLDLNVKKESANQRATADVVIGDNVILKDIPSTCLLGLEQKLDQYKKFLLNIPTLEEGKTWEIDTAKEGEVYKIVPDLKTLKTKKVFAFQILDKATKEHPAQIEKWEDVKNVGTYTLKTWSTMWTRKKKSAWMERMEALIEAVKIARQKANCQEVKDEKIGDAIIKFISCE